MPMNTPVASGRLGVRSPERYGRNVNPAAPPLATAASTSAWSIANSSRTHSVALVQLSVAASGSQPPAESQNAAASPSGSTAGSARYAKTVPDVPRLTATGPSTTRSQPIAAHMLSPPPALTRIPASSPSDSAASRRSMPTTLSDGASLGSARVQSRVASIAASTASHQRRARTSKYAVPDASPASVSNSPVNQRFR